MTTLVMSMYIFLPACCNGRQRNVRQVVDSGRQRQQVSRAHAHSLLACQQHLRGSDCHRPELISCHSVDDQCGWTQV